MDLIYSAWHASSFEPTEVVIVPANYGGIGGLLPLQMTPTFNPDEKQTEYNPWIPQWNRLAPIVWEQYIVAPAEIAALNQAGLIQMPTLLPATFTPPGNASLTPGG